MFYHQVVPKPSLIHGKWLWPLAHPDEMRRTQQKPLREMVDFTNQKLLSYHQTIRISGAKMRAQQVNHQKTVYQQKLACEATLGKRLSNKHAGGWMNNHGVGIVGISDNKCGNSKRETIHVTSAKINVENDNIFFYALPPTHLRLRFIILTTIALAVPVGISIHCIPILVAEKSQYGCPTP